ncbi:MAG: HAD-IIA family hydrolase [Promethearchaeota archaeon]
MNDRDSGRNLLTGLREKKIFFLDRDGTLTLGSQVIPGANKFLDRLVERRKIFYVLTNNSSKTPLEHFQRFKELGLHVELENVLVSIQAAISFMRTSGYKKVFWIATRAQSAFIEENGFEYDEETPEAIMLTYDTELTYEKLVKLTFLVRNNEIPYIATHPDIVCPTERGSVPDIGTIIKMMEMTTGRVPDRVFGKPEIGFVSPVLERHGLSLEDAVIIGDRLYTDIKLAGDTGLTSILVLTGESTREDHENSDVKADFVVESLEELLDYI